MSELNIPEIAEKFSGTWWDETDLIESDSNEIRALAADWLRLTAPLGGEFAEIEARENGKYITRSETALLQEVHNLTAAREADRQEIAELKMHVSDREYRLAGTEASLVQAGGEVETLKTRVEEKDAEIAGLRDALGVEVGRLERLGQGGAIPIDIAMITGNLVKDTRQSVIEIASRIRAALAAVPPAPASEGENKS